MCETPQTIPIIPFELLQIKKIVGGGSHTIFLLNNGHIFGCGWNHKGQLAMENSNDHPNIVRLKTVPEIVDVACGWDSTAAIDPDGLLFVWGSNAFGQLGYPTTTLKFSVQPLQLSMPDGDKVRSICFGLRHLAIWTDSDSIYFTGRIKFADQCTPLDWNGTKLWKLNKPNGNGDRVHVMASGQNHFVYANETNGKFIVRGIGDNRFGQSETIELPGSTKSLHSGWTHNAALCDDGHVLLWGRNSYGQLATVDTNSTAISRLDCGGRAVQCLQLGSEHGLAVCDMGSIYTWGWNEHGNCGNGSVNDV